MEGWKENKVDPEERKKEGVTRRQALRGLLSTMGVALVPFELGNGESDKVKETEEDKAEVVTEPEYAEYDEKSHSGFFNYEVEYYQSSFAAEIPQISNRLEVLDTIRSHFTLRRIPEPMAGYLEDLVVGMAIEESRLDEDAKSGAGAFGVLQLMPQTWDELAKEGESSDDLIDQVKVAARLLEQSYRHIENTCRQELDIICDVFFDGDYNTFQREFYTPLLINSYNAGMGSMATLVQWFVVKFQTPEDTVDLFEQSEVLTGYDVFLALAHGSTQEGVVAWYKEDASTYTTKIYGAKSAYESYIENLSD